MAKITHLFAASLLLTIVLSLDSSALAEEPTMQDLLDQIAALEALKRWRL
jgi:hypothetical protein